MDPVVLTEDDIQGASLEGRDPKKLTIQELRFWLSCRGVKHGKLKTKAELVSRVTQMVDDGSHCNIIDPTPQKIYSKQKLDGAQATSASTADSSELETTLSLPGSGWIKEIPKEFSFSDIQIQDHSLKTGKKASEKSQTRKKTCIRPETRGQQFYMEEFLHDIWCTTHENHLFFKSLCFPSQKKNDTPHKLWCALNQTSSYTVTKAQCSCKAGRSGYCNHVLALLYQLREFSLMTTTIIPDDLSKTSKIQAWHKPRIEGINAEPIMQCVIRPGKSDLSCTLYEARTEASIPNDVALIKSVKDELVKENALYGFGFMASSNPDEADLSRTQLGTFVPRGSVLSYQLALTEGNFHVNCNTWAFDKFRCTQNCIMRGAEYPPMPLGAEMMPTFPDTLSPDVIQALERLTVSKTEASLLEESTRAQSACPKWWEERQNRLTASSFGELCKRKKKNCEKLVARLQKKPDDSVKKVPQSLKHGKDYEALAVRKYMQYMSNIGHKVEVSRSGLVVRPELPYLGCSPDGKVMDPVSHPHFGILEVKCPYKYRGVKPNQAAEIDPDFCLQVGPLGSLSLRLDHLYYYQVQGQLGITGAEWCDFIVYTFKGLFIQRVARNDTFWQDMLEKLECFYFTDFLPLALVDKTDEATM